MKSTSGIESVSTTLSFTNERYNNSARSEESHSTKSSKTTVDQWTVQALKVTQSAESSLSLGDSAHKERSEDFNFTKFEKRLNKNASQATQEAKEQMQEKETYNKAFKTISGTLMAPQKQIKSQSEDIKEMRRIQLEIRETQAT